VWKSYHLRDSRVPPIFSADVTLTVSRAARLSASRRTFVAAGAEYHTRRMANSTRGGPLGAQRLAANPKPSTRFRRHSAKPAADAGAARTPRAAIARLSVVSPWRCRPRAPRREPFDDTAPQGAAIAAARGAGARPGVPHMTGDDSVVQGARRPCSAPRPGVWRVRKMWQVTVDADIWRGDSGAPCDRESDSEVRHRVRPTHDAARVIDTGGMMLAALCYLTPPSPRPGHPARVGGDAR
jgi:hypothetical protein